MAQGSAKGGGPVTDGHRQPIGTRTQVTDKPALDVDDRDVRELLIAILEETQAQNQLLAALIESLG